MAVPERDTVYTTDGTNRTTSATTSTYTRESNATGWFVGIIVALALLAIGYLVFSANSGPSTTSVDVNNNPAVTTPAPGDTTQPVPADTPAPAPMTEAPQQEGTTAAPAVPAEDTTAPAAAPAPATEPVPAVQ